MNGLAATEGPTVGSGWRASLNLGYRPQGARTALYRRRHSGPLTVQRPFYPEPDGTCHTYLLHPPAGVVGGDELVVSLDLAAGSRALATTPGATRWYRTRAAPATLWQEFNVAGDGMLEWLPQENLLFDGARARMSTRVRLAPAARFIGWEILGFGRPASRLPFVHGSLDFRLAIEREGRLLYHERLAGTDHIAGLRGHATTMSFVAVGAKDSDCDAARAVCADAGVVAAATLQGDVLLCRGLAHECAPLLDLSRTLWQGLRKNLTGRGAMVPRIWRT